MTGMSKSDNPEEGLTLPNDETDNPTLRASESGASGDVEREKEGIGRSYIGALRNKGRSFIKKLAGRRAPSGLVQAVAIKEMKISRDITRVLRVSMVQASPRRSSGLSLPQLMLREAGFLAELSHPNVIKFEGFVEDISKNRIWLIFPWEVNGNLRDFVASADWKIPERISLINDVAEGVEYLHGLQPPIYHGDLKSINILVNSEHRSVITDFGSARRLSVKDSEDGRQRTEQVPKELLLDVTFSASTQTMTLTGDKYTLRWAAPELLYECGPGLWSDIWALGWVGYEPMLVPKPAQISEATELPYHSPELLMKLGFMYKQQDDYPNASEHYTKALDVYTTVADNKGRADALYELAGIHRMQSEHSQAVSLYSECLQIYTDLGNKRGRADALKGLAEVHRVRQECDQAVTLYSECLQIRVDIDDQKGRADALWSLGEIHRDRNEFTEAAPFYAECLEICITIGDARGTSNALWGLGRMHWFKHEHTPAEAFFDECLQICTDMGDKLGTASALSGLADVHKARGEYDKAFALYSECLQIQADIGEIQGRAFTLKGLAGVYLARNELDQAFELYSECLQIDNDLGPTDLGALALLGICQVQVARGDLIPSLNAFSKLLKRATPSFTLRTLKGLRLLGDNYMQDFQDAFDNVRYASVLLQKQIEGIHDGASALEQGVNACQLIDEAGAI
ncbi:hypothetical protein FRC01_001807 [Tulasnella sp. 417]|nr:hypothetical protein FRC01_001807 [Tulasnella sp. 417]